LTFVVSKQFNIPFAIAHPDPAAANSFAKLITMLIRQPFSSAAVVAFTMMHLQQQKDIGVERGGRAESRQTRVISQQNNRLQFLALNKHQ
jgi:hypothetical protein